MSLLRSQITKLSSILTPFLKPHSVYIAGCYETIRNVTTTCQRFAGHSKWQNIRHTKGSKDAQKSMLSNKYSRLIKAAVRDGGHADPKLNARLANIIQQARSLNLTNTMIESALKSTTQAKGNVSSVIYEIKGPGKCFLIVEAETDNVMRTKNSVRAVLKKTNSSLVDGISKLFFDHKGIINVEPTDVHCLDKALEDAIEVGAEDVKEVTLIDEDKSVLQFLTEARDFNGVHKRLRELNYNIHSSSVEYIAHTKQALSDADLQETDKLYDLLENLPDVVNVYDNIE